MIVSLYLYVLSHRQLYVAFSSRVESGSDDQKVWVSWAQLDGSSGSYLQTKDVTQILQRLKKLLFTGSPPLYLLLFIATRQGKFSHYSYLLA